MDNIKKTMVELLRKTDMECRNKPCSSCKYEGMGFDCKFHLYLDSIFPAEYTIRCDLKDMDYQALKNAMLSTGQIMVVSGEPSSVEIIPQWIPVTEMLPEDGQKVLIYDGNAEQWKPSVNVARFRKGKTKEELAKIHYACISGADEDGNNKRPYCWDSTHSHMSWFGQYVTHWMPLPEHPAEVADNGR